MEQHDFERQARAVRPRITAIALRVLADAEEAEDVAQETLLKMWSLRDRLDEYRSFEGLAVVIARNRCLDIVRRQGRLHQVPLDDVDAADHNLNPEEAVIDSECEDEADTILSMLPMGQQVVLRMKHVEGLEVEEIARLTGSTPNAIRVTLSRARHRVLQLFNQRL